MTRTATRLPIMLQYPPNTTRAFFYLESRGSDRDWNETVFFGLQYLLKNYFLAPFTQEMVEEAREVITAHGLPFNYDGWTNLIKKHHGKLPLRIRAVAEGTVVPLHNVLMTVETTDDEFAWVGSWFETQLLRVWYAITVARKVIRSKKTFIDFCRKRRTMPTRKSLLKFTISAHAACRRRKRRQSAARRISSILWERTRWLHCFCIANFTTAKWLAFRFRRRNIRRLRVGDAKTKLKRIAIC